MNTLFWLWLLVLPFAPQQGTILDEAVRHYTHGDYREAADLLSPVAGTPEASADLKLWLGRSYLKLGEWDRAVRIMEKAVAMEPSNALYRLWLGRAYGGRAENRTFGFNDARRLLKEFKKASELAPDNTEIRFDLLEYYIQAPGIVGGSRDKAWEEAEIIARLNPRLGHTARATIHERDKKWDEARREYAAAARDFPDNPNSHKDLAIFLFSREDYGGALESALRLLEMDQSSTRGLFIAAACRAHLGVDLEDAAESLRTLAAGPLGEGGPSVDAVYYWQGVLWDRKGEKERSREAFEEALRINPKNRKAERYLETMK